MNHVLLVYLIIINAAGLLFMTVDKSLARHHIRRIPESTLLTIALLGGSLGSTIAMYLVRHKTRHFRFAIGLPLMLALHAALLIWCFIKL